MNDIELFGTVTLFLHVTIDYPRGKAVTLHKYHTCTRLQATERAAEFRRQNEHLAGTIEAVWQADKEYL